MIIGIGGVSNAGKSTLSKRIVEKLSADRECIILCQDDYVYPQSQIPKVKDMTDWECPESINFKEFIADINRYRETHDVVIAEGLFAFHLDELTKIYDKSIFIQIPKKLFLERKAKDDRWGPEPDWYIEHIWSSFLKYGNLEGVYDNLYFIDGMKEKDIDSILDYINS